MVMKRLESLLLCTEPDSGASTRLSPNEIEEYDPDIPVISVVTMYDDDDDIDDDDRRPTMDLFEPC